MHLKNRDVLGFCYVTGRQREYFSRSRRNAIEESGMYLTNKGILYLHSHKLFLTLLEKKSLPNCEQCFEKGGMHFVIFFFLSRMVLLLR